jgi:hypothetical protein
MIDEQIYLIKYTKTLSLHGLQQAHIVMYLSALYWHKERLEHTTWKAPCYPSVFCIFFPRLTQWLVNSPFFWLSRLQYPKFSLIRGPDRYKTHTPPTLLASSLRRATLNGYKCNDERQQILFENRRILQTDRWSFWKQCKLTKHSPTLYYIIRPAVYLPCCNIHYINLH